MTRHLVALGTILALPLIAGCQETTESNTPLSREAALQQAGIRLPLSESAENVLFRLSGKTQDWDLFLYFEAPLPDIEAVIQKELRLHKRLQSGEVNESRVDLLKSPKIEKIQGAPDWWTPELIINGFFASSISATGFGPCFWVDRERGRVFFYHHF